MTTPKMSQIPPISYWFCLVVAVCFAVVSVFAMRANNLQAIHLRDNVLAVDKANGDVEAALRELRTYVYSHMHTDLSADTNVYPPIQLKYRYDRLVTAEKARVEAAMSKVYLDAQAICEQQNPTDFSGRNRVPCIEQYATSHSITETAIAEDLYKFDFASPSWSPDLAGISLVVAGLFSALAAACFLIEQWLKGRLI